MDISGITTKAKILVLFANTYNMLDEQKQPLQGCSVHYLFWGESGEKLLEETEWDVSKPVGVQRSKASLDMSLRVKIPVAPALYEGTFELATGGDGKPVLRLRDVAFLDLVRINQHHLPGFSVPGMIVSQEPEPVTSNVVTPPPLPDAPKTSAKDKESK